MLESPADPDRNHRAIEALDLPARTLKPRTCGLTALTDNGVPAGSLAHFLDSYHGLIDLVKIGVGSAYVEPQLSKKLEIYSGYGIPVYFGGTLFEKFYVQGKLERYLHWIEDLRLSWIEVANGATAIPTSEMALMIEKISRRFNVLAEVGKKRAADGLCTCEWVEATRAYREAGCRYVVLEGRQTADIGIYDGCGCLLTGLVEAILEKNDPEQIIFEAATADSQNQLINLLGTNVNLGNVFFGDLLFLECQRLGLREETFFIDEKRYLPGSPPADSLQP